MRSGSIPIFLKNSNAFIIPSNTTDFNIKLFLEDTKQALESLSIQRESEQK